MCVTKHTHYYTKFNLIYPSTLYAQAEKIYMKRHKFNNPILMWNCRSFRINWMKERRIVDFGTLSLFYYYLKGRQKFFVPYKIDFFTLLDAHQRFFEIFLLKGIKKMSSPLSYKQQQQRGEVRDSKKLIITIKTHIEHNNRIHNSGRQQFIYFLTRN